MKRRKTSFFSESFGLTLGLILFIVLFVIISKELGVEKLNSIIFFIPSFLLIFIGSIIIFLFGLVFLFGTYDLTKNSRSTGKNLIVTGIYKYVRHPIYSGFIFVLLGLSLLINNTGIFLTGTLWLVFSYFQAKKEEIHLIKNFEKTYLQYQKKTPMFVPNFVKITKEIFLDK